MPESRWVEGPPTTPGLYWLMARGGTAPTWAYVRPVGEGLMLDGAGDMLGVARHRVTHHMPVIRPDPPDMTCRYEGCDRPATTLACGRDGYRPDAGGPDVVGHPRPARYCEEHADRVADEHGPEFHVDCPHCGCQFGVN
jgi:hypothetical protein